VGVWKQRNTFDFRAGVDRNYSLEGEAFRRVLARKQVGLLRQIEAQYQPQHWVVSLTVSWVAPISLVVWAARLVNACGTGMARKGRKCGVVARLVSQALSVSSTTHASNAVMRA